MGITGKFECRMGEGIQLLSTPLLNVQYLYTQNAIAYLHVLKCQLVSQMSISVLTSRGTYYSITSANYEVQNDPLSHLPLPAKKTSFAPTLACSLECRQQSPSEFINKEV